ncbi:hypothetical protein [Streptomyces sp. KR55]|uniref:hypothetical protein n=1 Tax=Streptomyces sp. KR55 TaxID=3457425 RepID=UPI003FD58FD5
MMTHVRHWISRKRWLAPLVAALLLGQMAVAMVTGAAQQTPTIDEPADEVHGLLVVSDSAAATATGRVAELIASSRPVDEVGHSITLYRR